MSTTEYIYVDSRTRDSNVFPNGNSYSVYLTNPLKNISKVELISATIPNTIYNLNLGINSNVLTFDSSNISLSSSYLSSNTLVTELNNTGKLPTGMTVTYSITEGKYLFANAASYTMNVTSQEMANLLGMPFGVVQSSVQILSSNLVYGSNSSLVNKYVIKSSNIADFTSNELLFLDIEELRNQNLNLGSKVSGNTFVNTISSKAFGPITLDVPQGTLKTFKENTDYSLGVDYPQVISKLSRLTVNWRDINGNLINFNGSNNNSFILRVTRTDVPPNKDRELGLPPPVPWSNYSSLVYNPMYILGFTVVVVFLLILFTKR